MKFLITLALATIATVSFASQDCCAGKAAAGKASSCSSKPMDAEAKFQAEAAQMFAQAEMAEKGKQACCKSTAVKPMAKGDAGCCNAEGETAKFKVFVAGEGYKFFGCKGSAGKGRTDLVAMGKQVGKVQKVTSKVAI